MPNLVGLKLTRSIQAFQNLSVRKDDAQSSIFVGVYTRNRATQKLHEIGLKDRHLKDMVLLLTLRKVVGESALNNDADTIAKM